MDRNERSEHRRIGERLVEADVITAEQLEWALGEHRRSAVQLGRVLVSSGYASERDVSLNLAHQASLPFVDLLTADPPDERVVQLLPYADAETLRLLPLWDDDGTIIVASPAPPQPLALAEATRLIGQPLLPAVVTPHAFETVFDSLHQREQLRRSTSSLASSSPDDSASPVLTLGQKIFLLAALGVLGVAMLRFPVEVGVALAAACSVLYSGLSLYKIQLIFRALTHQFEIETTKAEIDALADADLPIYTLLVPLYREAQVLPALIDAIDALDYPRAKLDVKLLLEEGDHETVAVARASRLPGYFSVLIVPPGPPKGKPKACNYGLLHARGEYVVIYDAEDLPERDQLKKALVAFRKGGQRLACIQAKLNFFNPRQNLLTRWFTTEYSMWFDLFLPGLDASNAPIPLGGTSNHFATQRLRELGAWDPHNVTEDADLGVRLYKAGWKTAMIDSTTYEEANSDVYNWIRQRSRWVKGYILTYLVHMRHPVRLWQQLGPSAFLSFQLVLGGTFVTLLVNPLLWCLTVLWFATRSELIHAIFPAPVFYLGTLALFLGNFTFVYLNVAGCIQRRYYDMAIYALVSPVYWVLMSIAAWKGFLQLFYAPSYWEKTNHGLHKVETDSSRVARGIKQGDTGMPGSQPHSLPGLWMPLAGDVRLSVLIPAFNEELRISATLAEVCAHLQAAVVDHEVLVVDDGSTDATLHVVYEAAQRYSSIRVLECPHRGKGAAVRSGVFAARGRQVMFCDADLPMPVEDLTRLACLLETAPVVIASREAEGATRTGEPLHRRLMGRGFNLLTRAMALPNVRDTQCGLKGFSAQAAQAIFSRQCVDGFGFDVEVLLIAKRMGFSMLEMPIKWSHRPSSRVDPIWDSLRMVAHLFRIQWNDWRGRYATITPGLAGVHSPHDVHASTVAAAAPEL